MACPDLGPGPVSSTWVQNDPSHSHVSPNIASPELPSPPNNTVRPRWESKVIAWSVRGPGPKFDLCVHRNLAIVAHLLLKLPLTCSSARDNLVDGLHPTGLTGFRRTSSVSFGPACLLHDRASSFQQTKNFWQSPRVRAVDNASSQ